MHEQQHAPHHADAGQSTAGAAAGASGQTAEGAVSALAAALAQAMTDSRQERTTARTADTNKTDTFESKTSDIGMEEVASLNALAQQATGFGNNKTIADVGSTLLFDRAVVAGNGINPLSQFTQQGITNLQNTAQAWNAFQLAVAQDNQTIKHLANLDVLNIRNDLAERGMLRDESSIARGQQRDQDALALVLIRALGSLEPIIIEKLRDTEFRAAFVALIVEALNKAKTPSS